MPRCRPGVVLAQKRNCVLTPRPSPAGGGVGVRGYCISHFSSTFSLKSQRPPLSSAEGTNTACAFFHSDSGRARDHMACDSGREKKYFPKRFSFQPWAQSRNWWSRQFVDSRSLRGKVVINDQIRPCKKVGDLEWGALLLNSSSV